MDAPLQPLLRELLGDQLRKERHRQGLTLVQVAEASGVSMQHLSDVERGCKDASSEILAAVTGALGMEVGDLLARIGTARAARTVRVLDLARRDDMYLADRDGTCLADRDARHAASEGPQLSIVA